MMKGLNDTGVTIWKIARIQRAKTYPRYRDRMAAAADLAMSASTLADIENGTREPLPDEVWAMSEIYGAPELRCTYCHDYCRLGSDVPKAENLSLDRISIQAYGTLKKAGEIKDSLMEIVADGKITEDEKPELRDIMKSLDDIVQVAQDLKVYVAKAKLEEEEEEF